MLRHASLVGWTRFYGFTAQVLSRHRRTLVGLCLSRRRAFLLYISTCRGTRATARQLNFKAFSRSMYSFGCPQRERLNLKLLKKTPRDCQVSVSDSKWTPLTTTYIRQQQHTALLLHVWHTHNCCCRRGKCYYSRPHQSMKYPNLPGSSSKEYVHL